MTPTELKALRVLKGASPGDMTVEAFAAAMGWLRVRRGQQTQAPMIPRAYRCLRSLRKRGWTVRRCASDGRYREYLTPEGEQAERENVKGDTL